VDEHQDDLAHFITESHRRKHLFPYLRELAEILQREQVAFLQKISELTKNVDHIKQIVVAQQSYAKSSGLVDNVDPAEMIDDALTTTSLGVAGKGITITTDFGELSVVCIDRHKALQILVNLMQNAMHALKEVERVEKVVTIRARINEERNLRIEVVDIGPGIAQEHLTRVFAHGFTTKKEGHGFGLHISATAAIEMGGSLTARSEGLGAGATFNLVIPPRSLDSRKLDA